MSVTSNITQERAARRFAQIAMLERQLQHMQHAIRERAADLKDLKDQHEALLSRLRTAARDEGELSLFDLDE